MSIQEAIFNEANSGATLSGNITAGVTSLAYAGADVFAVGDIIALDNEWMIVGAVNAGANTLSSLFRGKWTTAAPHLTGAVIRIVNPAATYTLPDNALQRLIDAWSGGPGTPVEEALKYELRALRAETLRREVETAKSAVTGALQAAASAVIAAEADEKAAFADDFPDVT